MRRLLIRMLAAAPDFRGKDALMRRLLIPLTGTYLRSGYGPWLRVKGADLTNRFALRCTRDYDRVYAEVDRLRPGTAFLDIGANAGIFSLVASARVGPSGAVAAFEPDPALFADLVANLRRNRATAVHPFNFAVGPTGGTARFRPGPEGHSGVGRLDGDGPARVAQIGPDELLARIGPLVADRRVTVKIDVEGAELLAIAALAPLLRRPQVEAAIVEIDRGNLERFGASPETLYAEMAVLGFTPSRGLDAAGHYDEVFRRASPAMSATPAR